MSSREDIRLVCECGNDRSFKFDITAREKGGVYVMCKKCGSEIALVPKEDKDVKDKN